MRTLTKEQETPKQEPKTTEKRLSELWEELLSQSPAPELLLETARLVPGLRQQAWERFATTRPSAQKLRDLLVMHHWQGIHTFPAQLLMDLYPTEGNLAKIITDVSELRDAAAKIYLNQNRTDQGVLLEIFRLSDDDALRERAALKLLDAQPTASILVRLLALESVAKKAGELLLASEPSDSCLQEIIFSVPELQERAWQTAKTEPPSDDFLCHIICFGVTKSSIKREAAQMLLKRPARKRNFCTYDAIAKEFSEMTEDVWAKISSLPEISNEELEQLALDVPALKDRALARRTPPKRDAKAIFGEILVVNSKNS